MMQPAPDIERRNPYRLLADAAEQQLKDDIRAELRAREERINLLEANYELTRRRGDHRGPA